MEKDSWKWWHLICIFKNQQDLAMWRRDRVSLANDISKNEEKVSKFLIVIMRKDWNNTFKYYENSSLCSALICGMCMVILATFPVWIPIGQNHEVFQMSDIIWVTVKYFHIIYYTQIMATRWKRCLNQWLLSEFIHHIKHSLEMCYAFQNPLGGEQIALLLREFTGMRQSPQCKQFLLI